jgi:adenosylcobinamide kinase/adenosylcobinamide-phosphate guanylyltransferase
MALILVTGPVRSGKTRTAMLVAKTTGRDVTYVATARPGVDDPEWAARLARHRVERPSEWKTIETASARLELATVIDDAGPTDTLVVDSMGTWLANHIPAVDSEPDRVKLCTVLYDQCAQVCKSLQRTRACVIAVSEETGWGIVPEHLSGRVFRDVLGFLNQNLMEMAWVAYLMVCGYPIDVKALPRRAP